MPLTAHSLISSGYTVGLESCRDMVLDGTADVTLDTVIGDKGEAGGAAGGAPLDDEAAAVGDGAAYRSPKGIVDVPGPCGSSGIGARLGDGIVGRIVADAVAAVSSSTSG